MAMEYNVIFAYEMGFGLLIAKGDLSVAYNTTMGEEGVGSTLGHIIMGIKRSAKTFMNIVFHLTQRDVVKL